VHEFFDVFFKYVKEDIRVELEAPFFQSSLNPQQLFKVLGDIVVVINTVEAEFDV